jgi:hypothetical protein
MISGTVNGGRSQDHERDSIGVKLADCLSLQLCDAICRDGIAWRILIHRLAICAWSRGREAADVAKFLQFWIGGGCLQEIPC